MTDRLGELNTAQSNPRSIASDDIESGPDPDTEKELAKFNREADAIDKVYLWANKSIHTINSALSDPDALPTVSSQLDTIEQKLDNVRVRLQRISAENKQLVSSQHSSPATLRIRVARCTKLANDFMDTVSSLQKVRETHKNVAANAVKQDILRANPNVTETQVQRALQDSDPAQLDAVMQTDNPQLTHQLEDLRHRNRDIQNLTKSIVQLNQMFTDMSLLVNGQQDLINEIEHNVTEVKKDTRKAAGELEEALAYQRSARKKKICICILITCIIIGIAAAIIIPVGLQNGWFRSNSSSGSSSSSSTPQPTSPAENNNQNNNSTTNDAANNTASATTRQSSLTSSELFIIPPNGVSPK